MKASSLLAAMALLDPDDEVRFMLYDEEITPCNATVVTDWGDFTMERGDLKILPEPDRTMTIQLESA